MPARFRRLAIGLPVLLALALLTGGAPTRVSAASSFTYDTYFSSSYERQVDSRTCTSASTAMMMNILNGRDLNLNQYSILHYSQIHDALNDAVQRGSDPLGWARAATYFSKYTARPTTYKWEAYTTEAAALKRAAFQIAKFGKAVGLLVQHGRHAVVMTGFTHNTESVEGLVQGDRDLLQRPARCATFVRLRGLFAAQQLSRARRDIRRDRRRVVRQVRDHRSKELTRGARGRGRGGVEGCRRARDTRDRLTRRGRSVALGNVSVTTRQARGRMPRVGARTANSRANQRPQVAVAVDRDAENRERYPNEDRPQPRSIPCQERDAERGDEESPAVIAVSSQVGLESTYAMTRPTATAAIAKAPVRKVKALLSRTCPSRTGGRRRHRGPA